MWGTTNSKPPGPIIMIDQLEILSLRQVQFITLVFGGAQLCCAFYQPRHAARIWCRKTNFLSQTDTFWLFLNEFYCLESHTEHRRRCSKSSWACWKICQAVVWFLRCVTIGIQPTTRVFSGKILCFHFFTWKYLILMYSMVFKKKMTQIRQVSKLLLFFNRFLQ
jgi:hypothetical protein